MNVVKSKKEQQVKQRCDKFCKNGSKKTQRLNDWKLQKNIGMLGDEEFRS